MDKSLVQVINNQVVVSSRQVAEHFEKQHKDVLESIREIFAAENSAASFFQETTFENRGKQYPEYLMNRDGFSLLVMGFTGKAALEWKVKYIKAFNEMEQAIKQGNNLPQMTQAQILAAIAQQQADQEQQLISLEQKVDDMRDVVSLSSASWRKDTAGIINRIAKNLGGPEHIEPLRTESYKLLNERMGVDLKARLTNKRRRMAEEGVSKTRQNNMNFLDIIGEDKKLTEGYVAIVKDMAIKYGLAKAA